MKSVVEQSEHSEEQNMEHLAQAAAFERCP